MQAHSPPQPLTQSASQKGIDLRPSDYLMPSDTPRNAREGDAIILAGRWSLPMIGLFRPPA